MNWAEIGRFALAFGAGLALGVLYFGGLWWTVRRLPRVRRPHVWTFGSFIIRATVTVAAFVWIANLEWRYAASCMAGFVLLRLVMTRVLRPDPKQKS